MLRCKLQIHTRVELRTLLKVIDSHKQIVIVEQEWVLLSLEVDEHISQQFEVIG